MRWLLLCFLCVALTGCGGGSSAPPVLNLPVFSTSRTGTWVGRETDSVSGQSGTLTLTINAARTVSGAWQTDAGVVWTVTGSVADNAVTVPPDNGIDVTLSTPGQTSLRALGSLSVASANQLTGSLTARQPGVSIGTAPVVLMFTVRLVRQ